MLGSRLQLACLLLGSAPGAALWGSFPAARPFAAAARATASSMSASAATKAFDKDAFDSVVMKTYGRFSLAVDRGQGCWLWDTEGTKYLDFAAGISTCSLGHADSRLAKAVSDQMQRVNHVSNLYYIPNQGELAAKLVDTCDADRAFFCNSGAEANEAAIKLARLHATQKLGADFPVIITALNSFHGRTLTAITATGQPKYQEGFGPLTPGFEYVPYNDVAALEAMAKQISRRGALRLPWQKKPQLAAILMEPLQGEGGIVPGQKEFFEAARRICDETGALLMVDEVQTGIGRTGTFWGHQQLGVDVDVITSAKALGGGVPIGAMLCRERCNVLAPGTHASTFGGNPLACAAGNAVLDAIEEDGLLENVAARSAQLREGLAEIKKELGCIEEVRGWGLILGIELTEASGFTGGELCGACLKAGLLTVPAGARVLRLVPPLTVSAAEADQALAKLKEALQALAAEKKA